MPLVEKLANKMSEREENDLRRAAILGGGVGLGVGSGVAANSYTMGVALGKAMTEKAQRGKESMQKDVLQVYNNVVKDSPRKKKVVDALLKRAGIGFIDGLPDVSAVGASQAKLIKPVPKKMLAAQAILAGAAVGVPTAVATAAALHYNDKQRYQHLREQIKDKFND